MPAKKFHTNQNSQGDYFYMNKQIYQTPEMEITRFEAEDIIRTSAYDYATDIMRAGNDLFYNPDNLYY